MASFIKDITKVGFSKVIIILSGLLTSVIIARTLGPEKNGIIASLLVYPSLFMSFGALGISDSATYFLGRGIFSEAQIKKAISYIWIFTSLFSVFCCFMLLYFFNNSTDDLALIILVLIPIPFALFNTYNSGVFLGKNQISSFNRINWIPYVITTILAFIFLIIFSLDILGVFLALIGGPLFIFSILIAKNNFIQLFKERINWGVVGKMLKLGLVYALALVIINLNYKLDIIILDLMSVPYEVGVYSKGAVITQYLWQIPMLFSTVIFARSANSTDEKSFSLKVIHLLRLSLIAIAIGSLVLMLFSDFIVYVLYGEAFHDSVSVLVIMIPGVLLLTFYKILVTDLSGRGKPWVSIKAMFPALIVNIILNIKLIPDYGADGAAIASTISYSIAALVFIYYYSKEVDITIKEIFYYKKSDFNPIVELFNKIKK